MPSFSLAFRLLAISDRHSGEIDLPNLAARGGALLLRDKDMTRTERVKLGRRVRDQTNALGIPLIVHGDVDLARELQAQGLHLPARTAPRLERGLIVGCSCHDEDELLRAIEARVDYVTLSPVLLSPKKAQALGWDHFSTLARSSSLPVFALGGLGPNDLAEARRHGAWGVAGIRGFIEAGHPARNGTAPS